MKTRVTYLTQGHRVTRLFPTGFVRELLPEGAVVLWAKLIFESRDEPISVERPSKRERVK